MLNQEKVEKTKEFIEVSNAASGGKLFVPDDTIKALEHVCNYAVEADRLLKELDKIMKRKDLKPEKKQSMVINAIISYRLLGL
ncbi:MAG: hypothetical protein K6F54_11320 [Lachnospiraceae bacterium]|nr:hypothetical protein [Lachnospiraceae bacterium]